VPATRTDDAVSIAYEARGEGPPDLLFIHGWAGSGAYFDETIRHIDLGRAQAITFDLRGHGESAKTEDGYSLDRFSADALAVADAAGAASFVVVGFSIGGKFAQHLAVTAPERVLGLVLVAGCPTTEIQLPPETLEDWLSRAGSSERMIELIEGFITAPVERQILERFGRDAAKVPVAALEQSAAVVASTSFEERVAEIGAPTLAVGGVHDPIFTPETLRQGVMAPLRHARLALLDSNHEIPIEKPRELAAMIEAFLAGLAPGSF
jgi:pimeloyl-ACP methyl ester carboxylesterase